MDMDVALSPEPRKLLEEGLRSGEYRSADDVVHAALEALNELEGQSLGDETLDAIDRAEEQIEQGRVHDWKEVREPLRARFLEE